MGVQGLTSFVERHGHFLHRQRVRNTRLVVDGCSLYYRLYFTSGLDQQHGGDYDSFASVVLQFFEALFTCHIQPFVVLDGGIDASDKKFQTIKERLQNKIREASSLSRDKNGSILPLLAREVFLQVLVSLHVPVVQCVSEADWEIAALANQWGCPVLSSDSDFYIFDLKGGYLPMSYFQWSDVVTCERTSVSHIPASLFSVNKFCAQFNHMNKELLPLFAILAGNDYVGVPSLERLFNAFRLPQGGKTSCRIENLLRWLARFKGPEQTLAEIEGQVGRQAVCAQLSSRMQEYRLSESHVASFFAGGSPTFILPYPLASLPPWVLQALFEARLMPLVINVLVLQRALLNVQVENCQLASSHAGSVLLRQELYGLLLDWKQRRGQGQGACDLGRGRAHSTRGRGQVQGACGLAQEQATYGQGLMHTVEEYDRHNLDLRRSAVPSPVSQLIRANPLEKMNEAPLATRQQLLLNMLQVPVSVVEISPPAFALAACVTVYWLRSCGPRVRLQHLQALMLGMVYGEVCKLKVSQRGPALSCVRLDRIRAACGDRTRLDLDSAHVFSQWQSCMWVSLHLNRLLGSPLPEPDCARLYTGTLVHRLVRELRGCVSAERMLEGALPEQLYSSLSSAIQGAGSPVSFAPASDSSKKRRRRRGGGRRPGAGGCANRFSLLQLDDG
ncbi:protein asteroid homolog 1 [Brienomyrus brachyistius]|uniref:protein asteroid homolog 1 n=1 Tax=Brienomyrus brachyistius TaxID=42636 RepID=UPI0020B39E4A|nr:protein asteroid homolog 1 [Brienomyrus brachyistius]XP_048849435.1 protein asteroid homolog 1 [Brienomyrus brachyistius]XP_048849436.1 protein asteroid homolog 1 [Brienomyrus brachyistius]